MDNNCDAIVWGGDINADFARNNQHTGLVKELLDDLNLATIWNTFEIDFTCSYEREGNSYISLLDHFFISEGLSSEIKNAGVIHHPTTFLIIHLSSVFFSLSLLISLQQKQSLKN